MKPVTRRVEKTGESIVFTVTDSGEWTVGIAVSVRGSSEGLKFQKKKKMFFWFFAISA